MSRCFKAMITNAPTGLKKGTTIVRPKSKGQILWCPTSLMKKMAFLCLTQEEYDQAKQSNPNIWIQAQAFLEYGENREDYWNSKKFMN